MKPFHRFTCLLAVFLLFAAMAPCVSAFTLSSVKVDPQGSQAAGTPMTVSFTIDFSSKSNLTFPTANELLLSTNLVNAQWVPVLVLNGMETSLPSKKGSGLVLPGSYVSYPSTEKVQVKGTLTGAMPADSSTDRNFLKIVEADSGAAVVSMANLEMPAPPVKTLATPTKKPATTAPTPLPVTTTQKSSSGIAVGVIATCGAALLVIRRK